MAINFPQNPTNGDTYTYNGITYVYEDIAGTGQTGQWVAGDIGSSQLYVLKNGDTMTGDLVVGNGAPFNGNAKGSELTTEGQVWACQDDDTDILFEGWKLGTSASTFSVRADGGTKFGTTDAAPAASNVEGCAIGSGGEYISISRENDLCLELNYKGTGGPGTAFRLLNNGNGANPSVQFGRDGSSRFLGQLQISTASVGGISEKVLLHETGWVRTYNATSTAGANLYLGFSDVNGAGTAAFFVTANGVVSARNTAISQIGSERRLKNTIEPLDPVTSWETIRDLPYYSYKLNGNDESTYYGPIVDECPEEMIVEGATSDEQGNIRTYDNSLLQGRLFVALQTALTRIEALEAQLTQPTGGASS